MVDQPGFLDLSDWLRDLSLKGDDLERIALLVDFAQFRPELERAGALERLFAQFDATLRASGFLAMGRQIVDATIVAAPSQCNTEAERAATVAGEIPQGSAQKPAKHQHAL